MAHLKNVTYLVKEELAFELMVRGCSPEGDVETLRKRLREAVQSGAEVSWREAMSLEEQVEKCRQKCEDWEGALSAFAEDPPMGRDRSRQLARLDHLLARARLLCAVPGLGASALAGLMEGAGLLQDIYNFLAEARTPSSVPSEPGFPLGTSSSLLGVTVNPTVTNVTSKTSENVTQSIVCPPSTSGDAPLTAVCVTGAVWPTLTAPLTVVSAASAPIMSLPNMVLSRPMMSETAAPVAGPSMGASGLSFNKLPNPWAPLVQSLQVLDGLNAEALVAFLSIFLRLSDVPGMTGAQLLALVLPFCRGPLAEIVNMGLSLGFTPDKFHESVVETFLPFRVREHISRLKFHRPQGSSEGLAVYVAAVKEARRVLRLSISEADTVSLILEGISPQERSRLVFSGRPTSFAELHKLCISSQSVWFADQQRVALEQSARAHGPISSVVGLPQNRAPENRGPVCHACGQRGHIRRFCPVGRGRGNGPSGGLLQ